jgi:four helix bundle protein
LAKPRGIFPAPLHDVPPRDLLQRTRLFALAVLAFSRKAPQKEEVQEAIRELRRSANSVRSNYRAARKGRSRGEFQSKLHIAFEEADECVDWLQYLKDGNLYEDAALLQEAKELAAILAAADRTARKNTARTRKVPKS